MQAASFSGHPASPMPTGLPTSVIVPLDTTAVSRSVLPLAYLLAGTFQAPLHRVHVAGRRERPDDHLHRVHDEALSLLHRRSPSAAGNSGGEPRLAGGRRTLERERTPADAEPATRDAAAAPAAYDEVTVVASGDLQVSHHGGADIDADPGGGDLPDVEVEGPDVADVEVVLSGHDPAETLAEYTRDRADAVVCMASRARGGLHRRLVGNVTEQVVRSSTCPVIAIGPNADRAAIGRPPAILLLAVGGGLPDATVEVVAAWAAAFGAEVVAAHVDPPTGAGAGGDGGQDEVVALSNRLQGLGVEARGRVVAGPRIAEALLTVAATLPQPLLLVAPVGERDDARVPTDVTHQLLHDGRWPVLASVGRR